MLPQCTCHGSTRTGLAPVALVPVPPSCTCMGMMRAGQSVVQFAQGITNGVDYAVKFFASQSAFLAEADLYRVPALRPMLPEVRLITDNADGAFRDVHGHPLAPCIVMERGESLDQWSRRARPDRFQTVSVCASHLLPVLLLPFDAFVRPIS